MVTPVYEIRSLQHSYGGKPALSIEHIVFKQASIVGLMGPNGSGKSTLLRLLGLIEKPGKGKIFFNGRPVEPFSYEARLLITLLPQEPFLLKRSVFGNISYGLKLRGNSADVATRVNEALAMVGLGSKDFSKRPWYALSGGEMQRVALAARLVLKPGVLLLDEPTAGVDAASAQLIKEASLQLRQELGTTLIIASHDWQWLHEVCDKILHLFNGRIFETDCKTILFGPWQELEPFIWGKKLSDNQHVKVSAPPNNESTALIEAFLITPDDSKTGSGDFVLRGTVSRLYLQKRTSRVFATVIAGNQPFTVGLTAQQTREQAIFPGKTMFIHYYPDQIKWI